MAGLAAGRLDRRVTLERALVRTSERGTEERAWVRLARVWAQRMPQRAIEAWKAGTSAGELETAWRIRWSPSVGDLGAADRLVFGDEVMAILGVTEIGRREGLEIVTRSSSDDAAGTDL